MKFLQKPYRWAAVYGVLLTFFSVFILLDAFIIPRELAQISQLQATTPPKPRVVAIVPTATKAATAKPVVTENNAQATPTVTEAVAMEPLITENSYQDDNISITIEEERLFDTPVYIAEIRLTSASYLKTAFASNTFGRNFKDKTSNMAKEHNAIFTVNGDYYGFRDTGYVLRNGLLYRNNGTGEALVIDTKGDLSISKENQITEDMLEDFWQVLSFGPALVIDSQVNPDKSSRVWQSKSSHPRTAIGQVSELHYIVIICDGRTNESKGMTLLQLAEQFEERGCVTAYNLDGGGSATMVFGDRVVNNPTGSGQSIRERGISDIVYIGYE